MVQRKNIRYFNPYDLSVDSYFILHPSDDISGNTYKTHECANFLQPIYQYLPEFNQVKQYQQE
jgi:hypothetical protein